MRGSRGVVLTAVTILLVGACSWQGTPPPEGSRPGFGGISRQERQSFQDAVSGTRDQVTGAFAVAAIGVRGSFDLASGSQQVDYSGYDVVDGKNQSYVYRRLGLGQEVYLQVDEDDRGGECWTDATGWSSYDTAEELDVDVIRLVDELEAVSGSNHEFRATAPVGLLRNALFGRPTSGSDVGPAVSLSGAAEAAAPNSTPVPLEVRTGAKAVAEIRVDLGDVLDALEAADVTVRDGFGSDVEDDYLRDIGEIRVSFTGYGFPVTIDRPDPRQIGLDSTERC